MGYIAPIKFRPGVCGVHDTEERVAQMPVSGSIQLIRYYAGLC